MMKTDLKSLPFELLAEQLQNMGEKAFRAKQLYEWMHVKLADSYEEMTNLPLSLREKLQADFSMTTLKLVQVQTSQLDGTKKYLFSLPDGALVESVLMKYKHGNSVCISSQVGCRMGCTFCASTLDGLARNLLPGEMLEQIYRIQRESGERVSNVVVMGTGEPMDNYDNVVTFIRMLTDDRGLHISQRNVTVSTCGLVDQMKKLAEEKFQITLALSLHAATDEKRKKMMPVANAYSISQLMDACGYYFEKTGRRITFEYALCSQVNDFPEDAKKLASLANAVGAHVNLIPVNPVEEREYERSNKESIIRFKQLLEKAHVNATVRREMGRDIDGACGQLRRRYTKS